MYTHFLKILSILLIVNTINSSAIKNGSDIVLVHALFRHGARTPLEFYPTDPHRNETFYPIGIGGLTNFGKLLMYNVGQTLRKEYGLLLGNNYSKEKIAIRSTDTPRTKMSALLVLAGLWPPSKIQTWHPTLAWIPIPIFSKTKLEEDLLTPTCKYRDTLTAKLPTNTALYDTYIKPHQELFRYIALYSGKEVETLLDILGFYFTLQTESENGLQLPEWTKKIYPQPLYRIMPQVYEYANSDPVIESIQSGFLLRKIIDDSNSKIRDAIGMKDRVMFLYSAHETNIGSLLHALKVFKREMPEYGSTIIFELHKRNQEYYIKVRHLRKPSTSIIEDLVLPNCEELCPMDKFIQLQADILPKVSYLEICSRV